MNDPRVAQLQRPADTAQAKARPFDRWLDLVPQFRRGKKKTFVPGLDGDALSAFYSSQRRAFHPRIIEGTFDVFVPMTWEKYEKARDAAVLRFIDAMERQGWHWQSQRRIRVEPGMYPAHDPISGVWLPDRQQFIIRAWFRFENPKPLRIELEPEIREPLEIVH